MAFTVEHQIELPTNTFLRATLKSLEVKDIPKRDGSGSFQRLNWLFEITESGEYFGKTVRAETSAFLSDAPHNVFRNWAEALLGGPLDLGTVLHESDLEGLTALVTLKYEEDRRDASKKWLRVADVIPMDPTSASYNQPPF